VPWLSVLLLSVLLLWVLLLRAAAPQWLPCSAVEPPLLLPVAGAALLAAAGRHPGSG
jgi:hypothetical protein